MSLFDNAIHSIQTSLNYYWRNDRLVSSVRNLYAGILLLFKHKLSTLSTPGANAALIKKNVIPLLMRAVCSYGRVLEVKLLMWPE